MVCDICGWALVGKPLKTVYVTRLDGTKEIWAHVCNFCYRGLYGFRYYPAYLRKAAEMIESEEGTYL